MKIEAPPKTQPRRNKKPLAQQVQIPIRKARIFWKERRDGTIYGVVVTRAYSSIGREYGDTNQFVKWWGDEDPHDVLFWLILSWWQKFRDEDDKLQALEQFSLVAGTRWVQEHIADIIGVRYGNNN